MPAAVTSPNSPTPVTNKHNRPSSALKAGRCNPAELASASDDDRLYASTSALKAGQPTELANANTHFAPAGANTDPYRPTGAFHAGRDDLAQLALSRDNDKGRGSTVYGDRDTNTRPAMCPKKQSRRMNYQASRNRARHHHSNGLSGWPGPLRTMVSPSAFSNVKADMYPSTASVNSGPGVSGDPPPHRPTISLPPRVANVVDEPEITCAATFNQTEDL